jgi:hypothetical protein
MSTGAGLATGRDRLSGIYSATLLAALIARVLKILRAIQAWEYWLVCNYATHCRCRFAFR